MPDKAVDHTEILKDAPKNWGRWGADDEVGCLNFLTDGEVLRGIRAVKQGKTFMLGVPVARPQGDPCTRSAPNRSAPRPTTRARTSAAGPSPSPAGSSTPTT
jgi:hypothetical protein